MNALAAKLEKVPAAGQRLSVQVADLSAPVVRWVVIDDTHVGQRLDNFLIGLLKGAPKSLIYRVVRSGEVRVNGARAPVDQRLELGDRIRIPPVRLASRPSETRSTRVPAVEFPVLFEDEHLLVINKPAGVAVHGGSGVSSGVIEQLRAARPQARMLELVHRIDRETSGALIIARRRPALTALHESMRQGQVGKRYLAWTWGRWSGPAQTIRLPLLRYLTPEGERRVRVSDDGQFAGTRLKCLAVGEYPGLGPVSLMQADLETGRTHQIRVHLAHLGFPLVGDEKYGQYELNKLLDKTDHNRMFLHAFKLKFVHPVDGSSVLIEAPIPATFSAFAEACHAPV
jgi:23S rRNA pseudouridine955/2504/2580 synthase